MFLSSLNITQQARCGPEIKKFYTKKCFWSALDKNSRQWSYKPIPPTAHAVSHKIITLVLTMRVSTLIPWKVVRNFCGSKNVPSLEGERKLRKSSRIIWGQANFVPYECSSGCFALTSPNLFLLFRRPFSCLPPAPPSPLPPLIYEGFRLGTGIYYVAQVLPNLLALSTFPDGPTISNNESVSRQNLWRIYDVRG